MRERAFLIVVRLREMLLPLFLLFALFGCAKKQTVDVALEAAVVTANTAYGLAVVECDAREQAIVNRQGSTEEQDLTDLMRIRAVCDRLYDALETSSRAAVEARNFLVPP